MQVTRKEEEKINLEPDVKNTHFRGNDKQIIKNNERLGLINI